MRVGGWRARLVGALGAAAIAAAALLPAAAVGTGGGSSFTTLGEAGSPSWGVASSGLPSSRVSSSGLAPVGPGAAAAARVDSTAVRPVHAASPARPVAQTPIWERTGVGATPGAAPAPPSATGGGVLAAMDGLDVASDATYVVDPVAHVVRVSVDLTAVNRLPVTPGARYYFPGVNLAVQLEARQFTADEGAARDRVTSKAQTGYRLLTVQFASRLYIGQTVKVHVAYVLPGGAPRSSSQVRVGAAYTTFVAWAFGDRGTVEVDVPSQFNVDVSGGPMDQGTNSSGQRVLSATAADPGGWYAWIDARNDSALTSRSIGLTNGEQVVVHAWPEDPTWEKGVAKTLTTAIPALEKRIGLPWPVTGQLSVLEVSSALLEGYAGFYSPGSQEITISEAVDPLTVVHEASHTWFNSSLFTDRWITEGLANEYAARTLTGLGVAVDGPAKVRANASPAFPLDTWGTPAPIKTRVQDAREQWGYDASWTVVRQVVAKLGEAKMAAVLAAANAGITAYSTGGSPQKSTRPADWRRFVDLAEEVGGGRAIAELIAPWVLTPAERALLAPRAAARSAYHDLVARGGGWDAPVVIRTDLDAWDFAGASSAIADAAAVVAIRDAIRVEAAAEHLTAPASLEAAYEGAASHDALTKAADDERALRASLDAVAAADAALQAPRDWLVGLGLVGQDPAARLAAARTAWAAGDATTATEEAASAHQAIAVAADAGRLRIIAIGAALAALVLLVILATTITRRRAAHRRQAAAAMAGSPAILASAGPSWPIAGSGDLPTSGWPRDASPVPPAPAASPFPPGQDWIDPRLAPPAPPPWWRPPAPPSPPVAPGPYPILPPNAAAGPSRQSPAGRQDGGAQ